LLLQSHKFQVNAGFGSLSVFAGGKLPAREAVMIKNVGAVP